VHVPEGAEDPPEGLEPVTLATLPEGVARPFTEVDGSRGRIVFIVPTHPDLTEDARYLLRWADAYRETKLPNGKVVVGGFCWGGGKTFLYSTVNADFKAGLVFYGSSAKPEDMGKIKAPVYGFYASNDARINAGLPAAVEGMKAAGKTFDPVTYEGAGHGFMRAGEDPAGSPENKQARADAWVRIKAILAKL
jgi:dienelactone hydrolase